MQAVREYAAGIAAAAMICAITSGFAGKGSMQSLMKLICGLVLTFAVIRPVLALTSGDWSTPEADYRAEAEAAATRGQEIADQALRDIITRQTEAYIQDKASRLGLQIQVRVSLSRDRPPVPEAVEITGSAAPYARSQLARFLREELGIREADQKWKA